MIDADPCLLSRLRALAREPFEATCERALGRGAPHLRAVVLSSSPPGERRRRLAEAGLDPVEALGLEIARRGVLHARRVLRVERGEALRRSLGLPEGRVEALLARRRPLPFDDGAQLEAFLRQLRGALGDAPGCQLRVIGTSATLFSLNPDKPPGHRFDADPTRRSDLDLGLESPSLSAWLRGRGAAVEPSRINAGGTIACAELVRVLPAVGGWLGRWGAVLGRKVEVVATGDGRPLRWPSVMDFVLPLPPG